VKTCEADVRHVGNLDGKRGQSKAHECMEHVGNHSVGECDAFGGKFVSETAPQLTDRTQTADGHSYTQRGHIFFFFRYDRVPRLALGFCTRTLCYQRALSKPLIAAEVQPGWQKVPPSLRSVPGLGITMLGAISRSWFVEVGRRPIRSRRQT